MLNDIMQEIGKVIIAVFGIACFIILIILLPFAFLFMLVLECVIRALDSITDWMQESRTDKQMWDDGWHDRDG